MSAVCFTVGIDPGLTGGIAVLNESGQIERVMDLPVIRDGKLSWIDGNRLQSFLIDAARGHLMRATIERVSSMPRQGIASAFNFGVGFGSVLAILQARYIAIDLVTPSTWKRALGLSSDKRASLDKARLLFPEAELHLAKHEGRAEALLIAHWAQQRKAAA